MIKDEDADTVVQITNRDGVSPVILVCEHASPFIPDRFAGLGLSDVAKRSHVAWDPGALAVACHMSHFLDAQLVACGISRLVYDCNRPPEAMDAMPAQSEAFTIPGNDSLSSEDKAHRIANYYQPFHHALAEQICGRSAPVIVTIHSFTPVYDGITRDVEIGVLHDIDARLADALLQTAPSHTSVNVQRNTPYGPEDGVTHTLEKQAIPGGHLNVMVEIRNDLIATKATQRAMGRTLSVWLIAALAQLGRQEEQLSCKV